MYITIPGGKKKRRKVAVKTEPPKPPEPDPRIEIGLKHLRRLASIRVELAPSPKIDRLIMQRALRAAFSVTGNVPQTQVSAVQQAEGKISQPDEELLLLLA